MALKIEASGTSLWEAIWNPLLSDKNKPTTKMLCAHFLEQARHRSLGPKKWVLGPFSGASSPQYGGSEAEQALQSKKRFLGSLPDTAIEKFDGLIDSSLLSKYNAVIGLLNLHNGENVYVNVGRSAKWSLIPMDRRQLEKIPYQFHLGPNYEMPGLTEYDHVLFEEHMKETSKKCTWKTSMDDLFPDFKKQMNRMVVPCVWSEWHFWVRVGRVISLGELFELLHSEYTAREIYYFYLHLEIVSVKRKKPGSKKDR
jgi:hypothetical protein